MKRNILSQLLVMAAFAFAATAQAQVGIGTNSPSASAQLEVSSASKGFLPPRVTLTGTSDVSTIASPATGLMVYNTATAGTAPNNVTPGFYYYDGTAWVRLIVTADNSIVTNDMLSGSIAAGKLVGSDIATVGTITTGTWNGTTVAVANGGTGSTTAAGALSNLGAIPSSEKAANNGVATLGSDGKIPAVSFQSANVVASESAMLNLSGAVVGSIAIRTDNDKNYVLSATPASTLVNWIELATPTSITSVNGNTGPNVSLTPANLGATTIGNNLFSLTNPGAITFPQFNANNTVSALSAADFRTAIGVGTGSGSVTSVDLATGTSGSDVNISGSPVTSSGTITLNIPNASATARGLVTTGAQAFAGAKTFSGNVGIGTTSTVERLQVGTGFAFHDGGDKVIGLGVNPSTFNSLLTNQWPAEIRLEPATGNLSFGTTSNGSAPALGASATLARRMTIARSGNVGIGTASPNASALLDLSSTTQGFLPPSMTSTQRNAITSPIAGLVVYNNTDHRLDVRQNSTWRSIATLDGTETFTNKTINGSSNTISNISLTSGVTGTLPVANGGTGVTTSTGSGNAVLATSPTLVTPIISTTTNSITSGAIRYNTADGGNLEYHNGTEWKTLAATKKVAVYTEVHTNSNSSGAYSSLAAFNEFGTVTADNVVAVYGSSNGFFNGSGSGSSGDKWVAPFTGKFRVTTNAYFNYNASYDNPRLYAYKANSSGGSPTVCNITSVNNTSKDISTSTSAIISMNQGDIIYWRVEGSGAQIYRGLYHTFFRIESVE